MQNRKLVIGGMIPSARSSVLIILVQSWECQPSLSLVTCSPMRFRSLTRSSDKMITTQKSCHCNADNAEFRAFDWQASPKIPMGGFLNNVNVKNVRLSDIEKNCHHCPSVQMSKRSQGNFLSKIICFKKFVKTRQLPAT